MIDSTSKIIMFFGLVEETTNELVAYVDDVVC